MTYFWKPASLNVQIEIYSCAKIVGKACGLPGVRPGNHPSAITTVGSQDTTGPMTADEIKELVCLEFQAPLVMQSFCHTAAYPRPADKPCTRNFRSSLRPGRSRPEPGDGINTFVA